MRCSLYYRLYQEQICDREFLIAGVDKIEVDAAKATLTVTGNVDPYKVILRARKAGKYAEVVSIGPPPPPPKPEPQKKPDDKKPDDKKPEPKVHFCDPYCYPICNRMAVVPMVQYCEEPNPSCSIM